MTKTRKDDVVTFEELGVDRLFVDESTLLQKSCFYTQKCEMSAALHRPKHRNLRDLFMKCQLS